MSDIIDHILGTIFGDSGRRKKRKARRDKNVVYVVQKSPTFEERLEEIFEHGLLGFILYLTGLELSSMWYSVPTPPTPPPPSGTRELKTSITDKCNITVNITSRVYLKQIAIKYNDIVRMSMSNIGAFSEVLLIPSSSNTIFDSEVTLFNDDVKEITSVSIFDSETVLFNNDVSEISSVSLFDSEVAMFNDDVSEVSSVTMFSVSISAPMWVSIKDSDNMTITVTKS